jgi:DeoR/GlpR family transcriptional regulator of sugar metabolism
MPTMLSSERRSRLLDILGREGAIRLEPVAELLGVSAMTVRRDLADLEAEGLVRRVRGGAVAPLALRLFRDRMETRSTSKAVIARKARDLVPASGAVAFDASTTSGMLIDLLEATDLVLATNSVDNATAARRRSGVRAILVGGELEERTGSFVGALALLGAGSLGYARFFVSAGAVSPDFGTSEISPEEAQVKAAFAATADETVLLADSSKLGQRAIARALDWSTIDVLVTELDPQDPALDPYRDLAEVR